MKKISSLLLIILLSMNICVNSVKADNYENVITSIDVQKYAEANCDIEVHICEWLDEINSLKSSPYEGKISVLKPFYLPWYSPINNNYHQETKLAYSIFAPIVCNNEVIGLAMFCFRGIKEVEFIQVYFLSENTNRSLKDKICFCSIVDQAEPRSSNVTSGGISQFGIATVDSHNRSNLSYYDASCFYNKEFRDVLYISNSALENKPTYEMLSKYYYADGSTPVIYTFDYKYSKKNCAIKSGEKYYIKNTDNMYLTFQNGHYKLTEVPVTKFLFIKDESNYFTISPETKTSTKITVVNNNLFSINLSYYNGYCYSICRYDIPDSMLISKGNDVAFSKVNTKNIGYKSKDWYITKD